MSFLLDEILSEKDKKVIVEKDIYELHFTLGLWICNHWIYPQDSEDAKKLLKKT